MFLVFKQITNRVINLFNLRYKKIFHTEEKLFQTSKFANPNNKPRVCTHNLSLCQIAARPTAYCFHKIKMLRHFILYAIPSRLANAKKSKIFRFFLNTRFKETVCQ